MNNNNNDNKYYNLELKLKCKYHKDAISCSTVLNDGRIAICSHDKSIVIYNNKTFKPDLIIFEHDDRVNYILQLISGLLASCSDDSTIKIYNIKNNKYEVLQILKYHDKDVMKIIELTNQKLVSCSYDYTIIIYSKDINNKYEKDYLIKSKASCNCVIQTKENEICYNEKDYDTICFYDLLEQKIKKKLSKVKVTGYNSFYMITKDLLLITGCGVLSIINVNQYNLIRIINAPDSSYICVSCMLNKNIILTGDSTRKIKQWRIDGDNLILISSKEEAHKNRIWALINLGDGHILSGSYDGEINLWQSYLN